ncbi:hypothetical protein [Vulgatibacter incomptus]|nr:hypothetical protein [Vulgatibacter incomptus]
MERRVPDWLLEKLALGELGRDEAAGVRRRLEAEDGGEARLKSLHASNRELLERYPAAPMARAIRQKVDGRRGAFAPASSAPARSASRQPAFGRRLVLGVAAAAPVALAAVLLIADGSPAPIVDPRGPETTRSKGLSPLLQVHRQGAEAAELLADGADVRAHEILQLSYIAAGSAYGVILSIDGSASVTRHLPEAGEAASLLESSGAVALPHAFELDDAPGFERFVFVTAPEPFAVEPVIAAARRVASDPAADRVPLALPAGLEQASFLVRKPR